MNYIQVNFDLPSQASTDLQDTLSYLLGEMGYESFFVQESGVYSAYIQEPNFCAKSLRELVESHPLLQSLKISYEYDLVPSEDWNKVWERHYYAPVEVLPGKLGVRASFHDPMPSVEQELIIDPRMAFGTGNHATTLGMLRLLSEIDTSGKQVIDMGCGSGILGIYAMKRGAKHCLCIDIDDAAVENAKYNAEQNNVSIEVKHGTADTLKGLAPVDILLANINRNIILEDCGRYVAALRPEGELLLSGFLGTDVPMIEEALLRLGWVTCDLTNPSGEWVAMRLTKE